MDWYIMDWRVKVFLIVFGLGYLYAFIWSIMNYGKYELMTEEFSKVKIRKNTK